jgi:hypothetical protein
MQFQVNVSAPTPTAMEPTSTTPTSQILDVLRQMLEVQREQLAQQRAILMAHDGAARWRAFLARWRNDFPALPEGCRAAMPILERSYGKLIAELTEHLCDNGSDALETDFALQEFLDRYGMRLTQLGMILNLVAPLAEAGSPSEST